MDNELKFTLTDAGTAAATGNAIAAGMKTGESAVEQFAASAQSNLSKSRVSAQDYIAGLKQMGVSAATLATEAQRLGVVLPSVGGGADRLGKSAKDAGVGLEQLSAYAQKLANAFPNMLNPTIQLGEGLVALKAAGYSNTQIFAVLNKEIQQTAATAMATGQTIHPLVATFLEMASAIQAESDATLRSNAALEQANLVRQGSAAILLGQLSAIQAMTSAQQQLAGVMPRGAVIPAGPANLADVGSVKAATASYNAMAVSMMDAANKQNQVVTSFKSAANPTIDLAAKLTSLRDAGQSSALVAQVYAKEITGAATAAKGFGQAIPPIVQEHANLIPKLKETGGLLDSLGLKWSTIKNMMVGLVAYRIIWGTFSAVAGAITDAYAAAVDFELSLTRLKVASGSSSGEIKSLGLELRQLAKDIVVPVLELSKLATVIARGGIDPKNLTEFTSSIAKFAEIAEIPFKEAAIDIMQFMRNMGEAPENVNKVTSTIFELGRASVASEVGVMRMASRLSGALGPLGASTPKVAALAAALADLGIKAEMGASSMQAIVTKMAQAVTEGGSKLKGFADIANMPMQKFASLMRTDVMAAVLAFLEGTANMRDDGIALIHTLTEVDIHEVRRLQTLLRLTGSMEKLQQFLKLGPEAYAAGNASANAYNELLETSAKKIEAMKIKWNDLAIDIGGKVSPALSGLATIIGNLVNNDAGLSITGLEYAITGLGISLARAEIATGITAIVVALKGLTAGGLIASITAAFSALVPIALIVATTFALYNIGMKIGEWKKYNEAIAGVDDTTANLYASSVHLADILNQEYGVVIPRGTKSLGDWNLEMQTAIKLKKDMLFVGPAEEGWRIPTALPEGKSGGGRAAGMSDAVKTIYDEFMKAKTITEDEDKAIQALNASGISAMMLFEKWGKVLEKWGGHVSAATRAILELGRANAAVKEQDWWKTFYEEQAGLGGYGGVGPKGGWKTIPMPGPGGITAQWEDMQQGIQDKLAGTVEAAITGAAEAISASKVTGDILKELDKLLDDVRFKTEEKLGKLFGPQHMTEKQQKLFIRQTTGVNIDALNERQRYIDSFVEGRHSLEGQLGAARALLDIGQDLDYVYEKLGSTIEKYPEYFTKAEWSMAMMGRMQETIMGGWMDIGSTIEKSLGDAVANFSFNVKSIFQSIRDSFNKLISDMIASWIHSFLRPILSGLANNMGSLFARFGFGSAMGGGMGGGVATTGAGVAQMLGQLGISGGSGAPGVVGAGSGGRFAGFMSGIGGSAIGGAGLGAMLGQNMGPYGAIAGGVGGGLLAAGLSGGMAAGAYGGTFGAGMMGGMGAFLTNPATIGIAIAAIAATLIYKSLTRGGTPSGAKESGRDFGVSVTPQTIDQFIQSIGLSKSGYEGVRKDIASSPKFLTEVLFPQAKATGTTEAFLRSLESVTTAWGTFNFRSAFETWMKTGDSTALNKAFIAAFSVSQRLQEVLPDWQQQLMAAGDKSKGANASRVGIHFNPSVTGPTYRPVTTPTQRDAPVTVNITVEGYYDSAGAKKLFENEIGPELVNQLSMNKPLVGRSVTLKAAMRGALA